MLRGEGLDGRVLENEKSKSIWKRVRRWVWGWTKFENKDKCVIICLGWKSERARKGIFALEGKVELSSRLIEIFL